MKEVNELHGDLGEAHQAEGTAIAKVWKWLYVLLVFGFGFGGAGA
jgi:hypothetical protein